MFHKTIPMIGALILIIALTGSPTGAAEKETPLMKDLESVNEIKDQFNEDKGKRRLLLLLSPT
jgi:hypothetical protein